MINQQALRGNWNEIQGKLRKRWAQLTSDDVQDFDGDVDRLVGLIQRKTGEGRQDVERFLDDVTASGASAVEQATEAVRGYAHQASERIQERTRQAAESMRQGYDSLRQGYEGAEEMVRRRPSEAAVVCFGAGVLTGLVVALLIHRK